MLRDLLKEEHASSPKLLDHLYKIISATRGPDWVGESGAETAKGLLTCVIRWFFLPEASLSWAIVQSPEEAKYMWGELTPEAQEVAARFIDENTHFTYHALVALRVLGLYEPEAVTYYTWLVDELKNLRDLSILKQVVRDTDE